MASLVLTDSSQLRDDGFEMLPNQIMYPYAEPYDLLKHVCAAVTPNSQNARNKPADGSGHVNQKGQAGQKAPVAGQKGGQTKPAQKPPSAQKGQVKAQPKAAAVKGGKKNKKGQRHQQHDLIVTIDLNTIVVSLLGKEEEAGGMIMVSLLGKIRGWEHDHGESLREDKRLGARSCLEVSSLASFRECPLPPPSSEAGSKSSNISPTSCVVGPLLSREEAVPHPV
uniref:Uncharacterized protein n=1 Tax=Timema cristinae TaxID=61476 RepID=A0A7R9DF58_TIMCR|nr:unnamed protein product [Timema cristinae]